MVYDPAAGFVTGGGWINSPAGAYSANTDLTGKATFGFVSKYQNGATVPTGNTEFQFLGGQSELHPLTPDRRVRRDISMRRVSNVNVESSFLLQWMPQTSSFAPYIAPTAMMKC